MFQTIIDALMGCSHRRRTFPITPKGAAEPHVCCLDCGREFTYDWATMRVGQQIDNLPIQRGASGLLEAR